MKYPAIVVSIILVMLTIPVSAQSPAAFTVMVNKGANEVKIGDKWHAIRTGSKLKANEEVRIGDNAYLGLVHVSGTPLEIKSSGNYKVADLTKKITGGKSVVNKYTDFILSANVEKKNKLSATGAVHRGSLNTKIYLPKSEVFSDEVVIDWERDSAFQTYVVTIKSIFGDEILTVETSKPLTVKLSDAKFASEPNLIVEVFPKGHPEKISDPPGFIKKTSPAERTRIKGIISSELGMVSAEPTAISKLIMAGFFEENNLLIDAITAWQQAIQLAPDVEQYRHDYAAFLQRHGIK